MKPVLMAAVLSTIFSSSPIMAATFSGASLSDFKVSLIDLDLNDGITPTISFVLTNSSLNGFVLNEESNSLENSQLFGGDISPHTSTLTTSTNTLTMSQSGNTIFNRALSVSGNTTGTTESFLGYTYFGGTRSGYDFTLSPNTQATFTTQAFNYIQSTPGTEESNETGLSYAQMDINSNDIRLTAVNNYVLKSLVDEPAISFIELSLLSLVFENSSAQEIRARINQFVVAGGNSGKEPVISPSAVPVPAALPLMASVIGLFGFGAMGRKAKKS